jgi:hypothetical protein
MKLVTVSWILEYLIQRVELGLVVVLDEVGYRFANVLDLLISVAERIECDGVGGLVDNVGAVVPVQDTSNALVLCGCRQKHDEHPLGSQMDRWLTIALKPITGQLVISVSGT